ncbi:MAG: hypothetical protein DRG50_04940 [Deltaproteobacteria bacterium]|nr:MAG: hypothetical protein DRG50_04940 [Deltaproteobacteria bacterium]
MFLVAVFLLFFPLLRWEKPPFVYWPAPPVNRGDSVPAQFKFAVFADNKEGWGVFKNILREIERRGYSFAVIVGDFVPRNREDRYRFFFRELAQLKGRTPIFFVPGNHDICDDSGRSDLENFHKYCGPDQYWFTWGDAAFVVLNDARSTITEEQFLWLKNILLRLTESSNHIFLFMHVPSFDPRQDKSYCLPKGVGEKFMALMEEFGVDYVFCSHIHCYFREVINGVTYIITGGAGARLKCPNAFYHYIQISVAGKEIRDSVIRVERSWWQQVKGDVRCTLQIKRPFLSLVMKQSLLYF